MQRYEIAGPLSRDFRKRRKRIVPENERRGRKAPNRQPKETAQRRVRGDTPKSGAVENAGSLPERAAPAISPGRLLHCYTVTGVCPTCNRCNNCNNCNNCDAPRGKATAATRRTGKKTTVLPPAGQERKRPDCHPPGRKENDRAAPGGQERKRPDYHPPGGKENDRAAARRKRTEPALSGACRSGKVLLSLCRFSKTVPIWQKHSIYS